MRSAWRSQCRHAYLKPHLLQHRRLDVDVQLLAVILAHAVHTVTAAGANLLVLRHVVFDALGRQVGRQRFAPTLAAFRLVDLRQSGVRQRERVISVVLGLGHLFGFVEHAIRELLTAGRKALALCKPQLLVEGLYARGQVSSTLLKAHGYRLGRPEEVQRRCVSMPLTIAMQPPKQVYVPP
ncbi:hypothetical protein QF000_000456 [Paraburkholderia atlantica]